MSTGSMSSPRSHAGHRGKEIHLGLEGPGDVRGIAESVLLARISDVGTGDSCLLEGREHHLRLVGRHDRVIEPLQEQHRAAHLIDEVHGRTVVHTPTLRQRRVVAGLELVSRHGEQCFEIGDPKEARARLEDIVERHGAQHDVSACTAAMDEQTVGVDLTAVDQMARARQAITDIDHAPLLVEAVPVVATVPGAATVVDVEVRKATAGPELHGGIQREAGGRRRTTMRAKQQRRLATGLRHDAVVSRRVVPGMRYLAFISRKCQMARCRDHRCIDRHRAAFGSDGSAHPGCNVEAHDTEWRIRVSGIKDDVVAAGADVERELRVRHIQAGQPA